MDLEEDPEAPVCPPVMRNFYDKYTVIAEAYIYWVNFKIYAIDATDDTGKIYWHRIGAESYPNPTDDINNAEVFVHGSVKWDGCSDWVFDEQERCMIHQCTRDGLVDMGRILAECWDMTRELCPRWDDDLN